MQLYYTFCVLGTELLSKSGAVNNFNKSDSRVSLVKKLNWTFICERNKKLDGFSSIDVTD